MEEFPVKRTSTPQSFQFPSDGETVYENPPTLIWIPVDNNENYKLSIYDKNGKTVEEIMTSKNFANPSTILNPGEYTWTVECGNLMRKSMKFKIAENAIIFKRPSAKALFDSYPTQHPAYLFEKCDIDMIKSEKKEEIKILKENVFAALKRDLPTHPMFHIVGYEESLRDYFGYYRVYCDEDMVACAIFYALTGDESAGKKAKELLFEICGFNPLGPFAIDGEYTDEVGLSNIRCLPPVFDLLYNILSEKERRYVAQTICVYAQQCENKLRKIDYEKNPSDSHVGRIPAYLGGAALVLKGTGVCDDKTLLRWLGYALEIYCGIFPYYGGNDGSWAEGTFYSTSYTKWFIPFFSAVERFSGCSLFNRPFYHKYTNFLIHFCNTDYEIHPFGDGYWCDSESKEWPGFFAQNPYSVYAEKFGPELARERSKKCMKQKIYRLHLLDIFLPKFKSEELSLAPEPGDVAVFPDGGFIAMHTDLKSKDDICVLVRASRFTYDSHRHADQGSFALFSKGVALISPSGYYGYRYGTNHHFKWLKSTKAHNSLLFNGVDQRVLNPLDAVGKIISVDKNNKTCLIDMSEAYPNIKLWQRSFVINGKVLTITDIVEADEEVEITYPLHTLSKPTDANGKIFVERKGERLEIEADGIYLSEITDKYDVDLNADVPVEYHVSMPQQYHIYFKSKKSNRHKIIVKYKVNK